MAISLRKRFLKEMTSLKDSHRQRINIPAYFTVLDRGEDQEIVMVYGLTDGEILNFCLSILDKQEVSSHAR